MSLEENPPVDNAYDVGKDEDMPQEEVQSSDNDSDEDTEYEEVDMTNNEMYQVLSMFLEDANGNNITESIQQVKTSVDALTSAMVAQTKVLFEIGRLIERKMRRQQTTTEAPQ